MNSMKRIRWILLAVTFSLLSDLAPQALAQPANAPPEPAQEVDPADKKDPQTLHEQTIYIPYDKLHKVFEQPGRGVFLPYEKFQQLWKQANQNTVSPQRQRTPLRSLIKVIESEANVRQDVVIVTANLTIELLGGGWHEVPLNLGDTAILSAKVGDQNARVVRRDGGYSLLLEVPQGKLPVPTEIQLVIQYAKAFTRTPGLNQLSIQAPQASINRWKIRIPEKGVKIQVQPMVAASEEPNVDGQQPPLAPAEETVLNAFFGATPTVVINWTPKAEGASGLKALATVQARQMVTISEGVQRTKAELIYQISRAKLTELKLHVPLQYKITGVFDDNVRQWEVVEAADGQEVTIQLFEPAIGNQKLIVDLERFDIGLGMAADMKSAIVAIPTIESLEVARQQGIVLVQLGPGLQAEVSRRAGLLQVDANDVVGKNWQFAYRYAALPFALELKVDKVSPEISSHELAEIQFSPQHVRSTLTAVFDIKRAGVFQLGLLIPEGYRIRALRGQQIGDAKPLQIDGYHQDEQEPTHYDVNLTRKAIGKVGLIVNIEKTITDPNLVAPTGESSDYLLEIPRVDPDRVDRVNGNLVVNAPISLRVTPGNLTGVRSVSFNEAFRNIARSQKLPSQLRAQHSYEYSAETFTGAFSLIRRQPEVHVDQLMHVNIESGTATYNIELHYQIFYSGVKTLRVDVPTSLLGTIRNTSSTIQESPLDPPPADVAEGYTAWELKSSQELIGHQRLTLYWQSEIGDLNIGSSTLLDLPYLIPQNVQRAAGQIVISKSENLDVVPTSLRENLRPIDPEHDLAEGRKIENASQAYEFHQDWKLQTKITRYDLQEIKPTAIERSVYRVRLDQNNNISIQALLLVRSVNQRIGLSFPPGADMTAEPLKINGVETSLEYEDNGDQGKKYYVPLRSANTNLPVLLEVNYRIKDSGGTIPVLKFDDQTAVHDCYLFLQIPEGWNLVGYQGDWDDYLPGSWIDLVAANTISVMLGQQPPQPDPNQIIRNMQQRAGGNTVIQNPLIGVPIPFTSLDPQQPLQVQTLASKWLNLTLFTVLGIFAVGGLRRKPGQQVVMLLLLMSASIAIGIILPLFSANAFSIEIAATVLGIAVIWLTLDVLQAFTKTPSFLPKSFLPKSFRRKQAPDLAGVEALPSSDASQAGGEKLTSPAVKSKSSTPDTPRLDPASQAEQQPPGDGDPPAEAIDPSTATESQENSDQDHATDPNEEEN
ncbi:MAG: hypothetical protein VB877_13280 [Pirellulaceae bacterium]